ncbi:glucose-6-phosphate isomerase [Roseiarcus fermentans]|uniref:Glucose-6-phosphate isomerase n=1 Tax=Roseiarcus fermentans TaxID=1473586 RepID=A0A366F585_9HYPH|nr:glucose-6-phosphate isomerase [Roseiarcus fermentans]RBP09812.1 glucose-6-phosphate isomerase [Roseiarcus fermentans]
MKLREPAVFQVDVAKGELAGAVNRYVKTLADLEGLYEDESAFLTLKGQLGAAVVYEVTDFKPSTDPGDMIVGVTRMRPGKVGREFFLTRGHIHANANRPEIYYGEKGRGVMLLESPKGEIRTVDIGARTLCYVPPFWIHRSVNVGADDLVMTFAYPADSGQDYAIIEEAGGMRSRVVDDGAGGWRLADNARYRGRPAARVERLSADAISPNQGDPR